jgi:hypothetical protein
MGDYLSLNIYLVRFRSDVSKLDVSALQMSSKGHIEPGIRGDEPSRQCGSVPANQRN